MNNFLKQILKNRTRDRINRYHIVNKFNKQTTEEFFGE